MSTTPIHRIQGTALLSPFSGQILSTRGVVTGTTKRGFFIQDPDGDPSDAASHGLFVYERRGRPPVGSVVEVEGRVVDYAPDEDARPTTQLEERETRLIAERGPRIEPVMLTASDVLIDHARLAEFLNSLEGMLVGVPAGSTFVAGSNPFGDYVVLPPGAELLRTNHGGVLIDPRAPERWLPGFRVLNYGEAPQVNVGAELLAPIIGPLNFRSASFQIAASGPVTISQSRIELQPTRLRPEPGRMTVLTLNGLNLDPHVEQAQRVHDPDRDVDDDRARFAGLARAIVEDANSPDVVALQEIQDDDGAEISEVVSAGRTLTRLVNEVRRLDGPTYRWADLPPEAGADGGQPGGNIRNAFLFNPARVELVDGSLERLGETHPAYEGSRKPLTGRFRLRDGGGELEIVNVHLASKRHQRGLFAPEEPGHDPRLPLRVEQASLIGARLAALRAAGVDYYVTGDFNDFEFSDTLQAPHRTTASTWSITCRSRSASTTTTAACRRR